MPQKTQVTGGNSHKKGSNSHTEFTQEFTINHKDLDAFAEMDSASKNANAEIYVYEKNVLGELICKNVFASCLPIVKEHCTQPNHLCGELKVYLHSVTEL